MKILNKATAAYGKFGLILIISLGAFLVLVLLFFPPSDGLRPVVGARNLDSDLLQGIVDEGDAEVAKDDDDLLPTGFDKESCLSRRQSLLYRGQPRVPASPRLLTKLRSYEARHRRCGPHTDSFNRSVDDLKSGRYSSARDCNYIVWMPYDGMGNRILTLASAFLFALLTDRVLLLDGGADDVRDLFCEPFPESSWLLPSDFSLTDEFRSLHHMSRQCYGEMLREKSNSSSSLAPQPYVYLNLLVDSNDQDKRFFCDEDQSYLQKIPWLVMRSNAYFVPSLFSMPSFGQELDRLFPDKETVFHLLARYLLHPTNSVWGLVTRYYKAYLAKADVTVGIQVRVFGATSSSGPFKHVLDQILSCTARENILPEISQEERDSVPSKKKVAVLMTSLTSGYFEGVRDVYWENPTATGEVVAVFQPSNEGRQQTERRGHNRKALAEIYLLSLTDKLVTSSTSTFGYVAQGLAGVRPWILEMPVNRTTPEPPCRRGMSMEPCYHGAPKHNICKTRRGVDRGGVSSHVRPCEDRSWDLKLFQT